MKKFLTLAMGTLMIAGLLVGCGNNATPPVDQETTDKVVDDNVDDTPEEVTLRVAWWGGDSRHAATSEALSAFMVKYPHITIKEEFGAWTDWETNMATQINSKTAPDVMQINWNWISSFSPNNDAFVDLNTLSDLDLTQFPQAGLDACAQDGNLQAAPVAMTGRIFYWNEDTFTAAGLETPKSMEDLINAGEVFKNTLGEDYYPMTMGEYDRMIFLVYYLESKFGKAWVENGKVNYTAEEVKVGMDLLKELEDKHVIPTIQKLDGDGADSLDKNINWIEGRYAGIFEWDTSAGKFIDAAQEGKIVIGDFFADIGEYKGGFTKVSMAFAVAANSKYPEESALLINYLLNDDEGVEIMSSQRGIPLSKNALKVTTEKDLLDKNVLEANEKVLAWSEYELDPLFEDAELKNAPDGVYYQVFGELSYSQTDSTQAAEDLVTRVQERLDK